MGVRWKMGEDVWECTCGSIVPMGQFCRRCGNGYGDVLSDKFETTKERNHKRQSKKFREPASEGSFTTSYFFKDKKDKRRNA